jgi:hypothetical protein
MICFRLPFYVDAFGIFLLESGSIPAVKVPVDTTIEDGLMDKADDTIALTPLSQVALQQIKHSIL